MKFSDFNLEPALLSSIEKLGYSECTPIQEKAIPILLAGKDVAGLAQTGTGKTAAFSIPLINRIIKEKVAQTWLERNFILVLVPTRELAEQVQSNIEKLGQDSLTRSVAIYGGTSYEKQKEAIAAGVEFVVATPGRLIDLYKEHIIDLKQVRAIVFDEADRMFDMGFKDDMKFILQRVPKERQFLVFSATLNFDVHNTAYQFGAEPVEIDVSRDQAKADNVKDEIFHVGDQDKPAYLLSLIQTYKPTQIIIFSNFKFNVERIVRFLNSNQVPALGISSLLTQAQRNRVLEQFKNPDGQNIMVATDVAARGLDIKGVDMVINYELPMDSESYVHRIGRTGRAGSEGRAFSLVCDKDVDSLARIEEYLKNKLPIGWLEDKDIIREFKPFPRDDQRPPGAQGPRPQRGGDRGGDRGGPRGPRNDSRGPRRDGRDQRDSRDSRDQRDPREQRHAGAPAGARPAHAKTNAQPQKPGFQSKDSRGPRPEQKRDFKRPDHRKQNGQGPAKPNPQHKGAKPRPAFVASKQKTVAQKITGFIKKLFS